MKTYRVTQVVETLYEWEVKAWSEEHALELIEGTDADHQSTELAHEEVRAL